MLMDAGESEGLNITLNSSKEDSSSLSGSVKSKSYDLNSHEMFPLLRSEKETPSTGASSNAFWSSQSVGAVVRSSKAITQVFQMPVEHQRRRDPSDRRGLADVCMAVGKDTKTTIEASRSGQTMACTFVIKGAENDISIARRRLWSQLAETVTVSLDVPEDCLGLVIGPGGKNVQALIAETYTNIKVPRPYQGQVYVTGDFEGISLAKQRVEELIHQKASKASATISMERHLLPFVLDCSPGITGTSMVRDFAEKSNVKIHYGGPKESNSISLIISGDRAQVAAASEVLEHQLDVAKKTIKSVSTKLPKSLHRLLIDSKGDSLQALEEETGCYIHVPHADDASDSIVVYGTEATLLKGLQAILDKTGSFDSQKLDVAAPIYHFLVHGQGAIVRELEQEYAVHISFSDPTLVVDGRKAEVAIALMKLKSAIQRLNSQHFETLHVDVALLKHLIGKSHRNIDHVKNDFSVDIVVVEANIFITASDPTACIKAHEHLQKQINDITNMTLAEINIDPKFYSQLIGLKGVAINALRQQYPDVMIDFLETTVSIRGPSQGVEQVKGELVRRVDAVKHEAIMKSYTAELECNPEMVRAATEKSGALTRLVQNAARKANVRVSLNTPSRILTITGLKSDADGFKKTLHELLVKITDRGSETIQISSNYRGSLIGKNGKNVKHLQQKYDVRLDFPEAGDEENSSITVTGPKANLQVAIDEIREFVEYQKLHSEQETIKVPREYVSAIVGRSGAVISEISLDTDCHIEIEKEADALGQVAVRIEGSASGIQEAIQRIGQILTVRSETVAVEKAQIEQLQGAGSVFYKALLEDAKARGVQVSLRRNSGEIVLRGDVNAVEVIMAELKELLREEFRVEHVVIPSKHHGEIIGQRGENVRRLSMAHNVLISFPNGARHNSIAPDTVQVEGRPADVALARQELLKYVRDVKIVSVPRRVCTTLLEALRDDFAKLNVHASQEKKLEAIRLTGDKEHVEVAAQLVADHLAKDDYLVEKLEIPQAQHRVIIGKGGVEIEGLRRTTGCQIAVPPAYKISNTLVLSGTTAAVGKAKEAILRLVDSSFL